MKFFTKEWYDKMQKAHLLTIPESDEEWMDFIKSFEEDGEDVYDYLRQDLESIKDELLQTLPETFHPYILDGTINQPTLPKEVRDELIIWLKAKIEECEKVLDEANNHFEHIRENLPEELISILEDGLHDAELQYIHRDYDALRLTLNGEGSFSKGDAIVIEITGIKEEQSEIPLTPGMFWLYEEGDLNNKSFILSVLFDNPMTEWKVAAKQFSITHFYKTQIFHHDQEFEKENHSRHKAKKERHSLPYKLPDQYASFVTALHEGEAEKMYFLTEKEAIEIDRFLSLEELKLEGSVIPIAVCTNGNIVLHLETQKIFYLGANTEELAENFEKFLEGLYSKQFVDEMPLLSEPLPTEELESALFSEDLELIIRAWNTIVQEPEKHIPLIEKTLPYSLQHENEEIQQIGEVYMDHILSFNILSEQFINKLRKST
ncbi:DUF4085 family protein [Aeribacillus sp. FSL K6-1305]|uniref:DUF4085 family protein n=1 Tax=Aeribacillus sp. FSL K6-1305 TaxID=2954569 RepID=UPI0030FD91C7